jgi:hypothetical protein
VGRGAAKKHMPQGSTNLVILPRGIFCGRVSETFPPAGQLAGCITMVEGEMSSGTARKEDEYGPAYYSWISGGRESNMHVSRFDRSSKPTHAGTRIGHKLLQGAAGPRVNRPAVMLRDNEAFALYWSL